VRLLIIFLILLTLTRAATPTAKESNKNPKIEVIRIARLLSENRLAKNNVNCDIYVLSILYSTALIHFSKANTFQVNIFLFLAQSY